MPNLDSDRPYRGRGCDYCGRPAVAYLTATTPEPGGIARNLCTIHMQGAVRLLKELQRVPGANVHMDISPARQ